MTYRWIKQQKNEGRGHYRIVADEEFGNQPCLESYVSPILNEADSSFVGRLEADLHRLKDGRQ